jgi:hypothetical protein
VQQGHRGHHIVFIKNIGLAQVPSVELSYRPVGSNRGKNWGVGPKGDVEDFFVMGNQLFDLLLSVDVPERTSRINARGTNGLQFLLVPVEGGKRGSQFFVLEVAFQFGLFIIV